MTISIFVDASAMVAAIAGEQVADVPLERIEPLLSGLCRHTDKPIVHFI